MAFNDIVKDLQLDAVLQTSSQSREQAELLVDCLPEAGQSVSPEQEAAISKQQKLLFTSIAHLRGLHRAAILTARETKSKTAEKRHEVDGLHLQLQNLYYEQSHLKAEIAACESYE